MVAKKKATEEVTGSPTVGEPIAAPTPPVTSSAPPPEPPRPILPSLDETFGPPLRISFEGWNEVIVSDAQGALTLARRLAMAYAALTRGKTSDTGICCDPRKAFEVVSFDRKTMVVTARLRSGTETMTLPCADPKWLDKIPDQHLVDGLTTITAATGINYGSLHQVTVMSECPNCSSFISRHNFEETLTDDLGVQMIATCRKCGWKLKRFRGF